MTSSLNCEKYIEGTIRSVLDQGYANLQYIVVDAGSTDSTMDIINRYSSKIDIVINEPDEGQYFGTQKGLQLATGEIMAWLNADDMYYPWTFSVVDTVFRHFPEIDWIIGQPSYMNADGQCIKVSGNSGTAYPRNYVRNGWFRKNLGGYLQQESMFWRKKLWDKVGGFNLCYKYAADFDLWVKFAEYTELNSVACPLGIFRKRPGEQNSSVWGNQYENEVAAICRNLEKPPLLWRAMAKRGLVAVHLCRSMIWKKNEICCLFGKGF